MPGRAPVRGGGAYSPYTAKRPKDVYEKPGFKKLLGFISDEVILAKFVEILISEDKRASLDAGKELLKLKDRYPANKLKVTAYQESLDEF